MKIRSSVKAIIIEDNCLLTIKKQDNKGMLHILPGGGQKHGETLEDAIIRECIEELGVRVKVNELLFVREYIGINHENVDSDQDIHIVEHIFSCSLSKTAKNEFIGTHQDEDQVGVEWIDINQLANSRFYPKTLISKLYNFNLDEKVSKVYIGDIN